MTRPALHSIQTSTQILGIGRSSLYGLIAQGQISAVKIGRRTLIPDQEIQRYVESLITINDQTPIAGAGK
ncbi:helix-turn-helix domain-containing protein [bacterium]|nr:helix-turn-helix domain-containing protein [bacterium]